MIQLREISIELKWNR